MSPDTPGAIITLDYEVVVGSQKRAHRAYLAGTYETAERARVVAERFRAIDDAGYNPLHKMVQWHHDSGRGGLFDLGEAERFLAEAEEERRRATA